MKLTYTIHQLPQTANAFWTIAENERVIAFHGKMGSGKTTLIHALCESMAVKDVVGSPTFAIINEYIVTGNHTKKFFHIDLYRIRDEQEAIQAGVEDCIYSDHICLVEWPEKILSLLPANTLHVYIDVVDEQTRSLRIGDN